MAMKIFKDNTVAVFILITINLFLFINCSDRVDFGIIPVIKFENYQVFTNQFGKDTALTLTISFTDADGDLGLEQSDTFPPFNSGSKYHYCMYIHYYEFIDSVWKEVRPEIGGIPIGDTIRFPYRFRSLTPNTPNKAIKGEIDWHSNLIEPQKSKYIKFAIYIYDRRLHKSNLIESPSIFYNR